MYARDEIVNFDNGVISGRGRVKGIAQAPDPVLGTLYIIEVITSSEPIPNLIYNYSHIALHDVHLTAV